MLKQDTEIKGSKSKLLSTNSSLYQPADQKIISRYSAHFLAFLSFWLDLLQNPRNKKKLQERFLISESYSPDFYEGQPGSLIEILKNNKTQKSKMMLKAIYNLWFLDESLIHPATKAVQAIVFFEYSRPATVISEKTLFQQVKIVAADLAAKYQHSLAQMLENLSNRAQFWEEFTYYLFSEFYQLEVNHYYQKYFRNVIENNSAKLQSHQ